jgi:hypothetical protein
MRPQNLGPRDTIVEVVPGPIPDFSTLPAIIADNFAAYRLDVLIQFHRTNREPVENLHRHRFTPLAIEPTGAGDGVRDAGRMHRDRRTNCDDIVIEALD